MEKVHPILFTPGPLRVSERVKERVRQSDLMHRGYVFADILVGLQKKLVKVLELNNEYFPVIFTSTGRGVNEAMIAPYVLSKNPLIVSNGSWGDNLIRIAEYYRKDVARLQLPKDKKIDQREIDVYLESKPAIDTLIVVHQETRSGILNPLEDIGELAKKHGCVLLVDAMSSAIVEEINFKSIGVSLFTTSSAKGLRSFPGLGIVCGKSEEFERIKTYKKASYYFDLYDEFERQKNAGEVRFAQPPILFNALTEAVDEILEEGVENRRSTIHGRTKEFRKWARENGLTFAFHESELGHAVTTFTLTTHKTYKDFKDELRNLGVFLLYGDSYQGNQFQVSFMGALEDAHTELLKESLLRVLGK